MSDLVPLAQAHCVPRRGHEHRLPPAQIAELMPQLPGWELADPDLGVHYDRCVVRFSTHDVGGLSENDFICAAKAEALAE